MDKLITYLNDVKYSFTGIMLGYHISLSDISYILIEENGTEKCLQL